MDIKKRETDELRAAQILAFKLRLHNHFTPVKRFGDPSAYGSIFNTSGNKLMKIAIWTRNSEREMKIARIAGNANVGPKVYNTRKWTPRTVGEYALLKDLFPNKNPNNIEHVAVITMNKVPDAKSLYRAIKNGTITNFKQIEKAIELMHAAGIHHGNLHGENILVYVNNSGQVRFKIIDFGASKYSKKIINSRSAVRCATEQGGWRGCGTSKTVGGFTRYYRPGRNQFVRSNEAMLANLRKYFNFYTKKQKTPPNSRTS